MDYRNILATGFLLLCGAVFVHSLKSANAFPQGPNVSMGSNPIESLYGSVTGYNGGTIMTVPSNQDFIVTTILTSSPYNSYVGDGASCDTYIDTTKVIDGYAGWTWTFGRTQLNHNNPSTTTAFTQGNAKLKISGGSELIMKATGSNTIVCNYYIEGYYVNP